MEEEEMHDHSIQEQVFPQNEIIKRAKESILSINFDACKIKLDEIMKTIFEESDFDNDNYEDFEED